MAIGLFENLIHVSLFGKKLDTGAVTFKLTLVDNVWQEPGQAMSAADLVDISGELCKKMPQMF